MLEAMQRHHEATRRGEERQAVGRKGFDRWRRKASEGSLRRLGASDNDGKEEEGGDVASAGTDGDGLTALRPSLQRLMTARSVGTSRRRQQSKPASRRRRAASHRASRAEAADLRQQIQLLVSRTTAAPRALTMEDISDL